MGYYMVCARDICSLNALVTNHMFIPHALIITKIACFIKVVIPHALIITKIACFIKVVAMAILMCYKIGDTHSFIAISDMPTPACSMHRNALLVI